MPAGTSPPADRSKSRCRGGPAVPAARCGAAAPAVPVKDTIKQASDGLVSATLDRSQLYAVQTPQVFETSLIKAALTKALEDGVALTDDCAAVERLGLGVACYLSFCRLVLFAKPTTFAIVKTKATPPRGACYGINTNTHNHY